METRKLSSIIFADIVGYSAMMQADEPRALQTLDQFKILIEDKTIHHQGEIIQYYGDGCLLSFDSALHAVHAGQSLQEGFIKHGIPVRIGMHLGDVLYKNGNAYGDGVNIASRVESLGVAGSVLLTKSIRDQIKNKTEFDLSLLGSFQFKNITEPMAVYALQGAGFSLPDPNSMTGKLEASQSSAFQASPQPVKASKPIALYAILALALILLTVFVGKNFMEDASSVTEGAYDKASIAVLPFSNLSTNEDNAFFAAGIHEDVLNKLAALKELRVMSRTAVLQFQDFEGDLKEVGKQLDVQYIVEGTVSRWEDQVKITTKLIEIETGESLWSHTYDRKLENIFTLQGEIAQQVVSNLHTNISQQGQDKLSEVSTTVIEAYDNFVQARSIFSSSWYNFEQLDQANAFLEKAVRYDPGFVAGWSLLAQGRSEHAGRLREVGDSLNLPDAILAADSALNTLQSLQPDGFYFYRANGYYLDILKEEHIKALNSFNKALEQVPNDGPTLNYMAQASFKLGQLNEGVKALENAYAIDNQNAMIAYMLSMAYELTHQYDKAARFMERLVELEPEKTHYGVQAKYFQFLADGSVASFKEYEKAVQTVEETEKYDSRSVLNNKMVVAMFNDDYETYVNAWIGKWQGHYAGHGNWSCPMILNDEANQAHLMIQYGDEQDFQKAQEIISQAKANISRPYHKHAFCIFNKASYNPKLEIMSGDTTRARKEFEAAIPVVMNNDLFPRGPVERSVLLETADLVAPEQVYTIYKQVTGHSVSFTSLEKVCANPWVYPNLIKDPQFVQEVRKDGRFIAFLESYSLI